MIEPRIETKRLTLAVDDLDADGSFTGYASLFELPDLGRDVVARGAFVRSLQTRGAAGIRMLFQHDPAQPIGRWLELREDSRGLLVRGQLALDVARARDVHALMRAGGLDGLSIGFRALRAKAEAGTGLRRILEADLWEISVVTFPMQGAARIHQVKTAHQGLPTTRDFERWLTQDAGLTRSQARCVIAKGFNELKRERDAATAFPTDLAGTIRRAATLFHSKDPA
ncbi:HK97 family phage prohead protease [Tianweitania sediminis]|uniref:HK97 family phage prohead protease n=1 Tax=Tianweitania sediminis TaxID=1502156 RepID=A0A8J7R296_9HYPH|nr:HK97 family phage prohead protease [Tianweitania sediminis]MBP0438895.1 HK97 family phage prohead protease [Tianweitania sediminis]